MAMPFSPNTTYVDDSLPAIAAADLNALQLYLSALYSASKSIIGLKIDGVGNGAGPASPGQLDVQSTLVDTAIGIFRDKLGNVRSVFDHNGYPSGRRSEYRENWDFSIATNSIFTQQSIFGGTGFSRWNGTTTSGTRNTFQTKPGGAGNFSSYMTIGSASAINADACVLYGQYPWAQITANLSLVMEFEVRIASPSAATLFFGLIDFNNAGGSLPPGAVVSAGLFKRNADTNWQAYVSDGSLSSITDLGVVAATATWFPVRIELHGANSPYGACTRFFINGTFVGTITSHATTLGVAALTPQMAYWATGASSVNMDASPLFVTYNRGALSLPTV